MAFPSRQDLVPETRHGFVKQCFFNSVSSFSCMHVCKYNANETMFVVVQSVVQTSVG